MEQLPFFVYGTLKRGFANHRLFDRFNITSVSEGTIAGRLYLKSNGLPYTLHEDGVVRGEVYSFPEDEYPVVLCCLDGLEGYRGDDAREYSYYVRDRVQVTTPDGVIEAWAYFGKTEEPGSRLLADGVYPQPCAFCWMHPATDPECPYNREEAEDDDFASV